jgi:hypothetical protein
VEEAERRVTLAALGVEKHPREALAADLGVSGWWLPGQQPADHRAGVPPAQTGAPAWWKGDEEASQSFLTAMGVRL